ncbi:MAG: metal-dependent transcriptional regulator [Planctomycetota bacterium]
MARTERKPTASQEDYLEAILALVADGAEARAGDIARRLGVSKPSVTGALKVLARRGWVRYEPYGRVELADAGRRAAERVRRRHEVLRRFLADIAGVEPSVADANACRMEHVLDERAMQAVRHLTDFASHSPAGRRFVNALAKARREEGA